MPSDDYQQQRICASHHPRLCKHMLVGLERCQNKGVVQVRPCANDDGINFRVLNHLLPVSRHLKHRTEVAGHVLQRSPHAERHCATHCNARQRELIHHRLS